MTSILGLGHSIILRIPFQSLYKQLYMFKNLYSFVCNSVDILKAEEYPKSSPWNSTFIILPGADGVQDDRLISRITIWCGIAVISWTRAASLPLSVFLVSDGIVKREHVDG